MTATAIGTYATAAEFKRLAGITDTTDDTLIGLICDRVNQEIESMTRQYVGPIASATYLYDGNALRRIFLPMPVGVTDGSPPAGSTLAGVGGARAVSAVAVADYTGGDFYTLTSTDYFLRQKHGVSGPYRWLELSDKPAGTYQYRTFPDGIANVKVTMTAGWTAIPDDLIQTALFIAQRTWNARQMGREDADVIASVPNFIAKSDRERVARYALKAPI